jgi:hypothetical protein
MRLRLKGIALPIEVAERKGKPFRTEGGKPHEEGCTKGGATLRRIRLH